MEVTYLLEVQGPWYNALPLNGMDMSLSGPNLENASISLSIFIILCPLMGFHPEYYPSKVTEDFYIHFSET